MRRYFESSFPVNSYTDLLDLANKFESRVDGSKWVAIFRFYPQWDEAILYIFDMPLPFDSGELLVKEHHVLSLYASVTIGQSHSQKDYSACKVYKMQFNSANGRFYGECGDQQVSKATRSLDNVLETSCSCGAAHTSFPSLHLHYCAQYLPFT